MQTNTTQAVAMIDVPISNLIPSPRNVRKSKPDKEADQELLAGIRECGLLQNLVVIQNTEPGIYEVVAGKRRLKALQTLVKEGRYKDTDTVACQWIADAANAEEISLIENTQRVRMHPADEFEACQKMFKNGNGTETIAAALGIPESTVKKRLKLAQVAPAIIKAYRADDITLEAVMSFTSTDNRERQLEVFNALLASQRLSPYHIRHALHGETENTASRIGKFVGEKAYTKAGGAVSHDLFREITYFEDAELLNKLAVAKLQKIADGLQGWNWVEIVVEEGPIPAFSFLTPRDTEETIKLQEQLDVIQEKLEQLETSDDGEDDWQEAHGEHYRRLETQLEVVEEKIEQSRDYIPEEMALAGCIVTIDNGGNAKIIKGLVRKSEEKALRDIQTTADDSDTHSSNAGSKKSRNQQPAEDTSEFSQALVDDLITYRTNIAKRFLAIGGEDVARDLLYYTLAMEVFGDHYYGGPLNVSISETRTASSLIKPDTGRAQRELQDHRENVLKLDWISIDDDLDRFRTFSALDHADKSALMAYCVAQSLVLDLAQIRRDEAEIAIESLDIPWHKYFQPTVDNYLGRVSKDTLLQLGSQFFTDFRAEGAEKRTKKQLAQELETILAGEDKTMSADKRAEAIDWIPAGFVPL